MVTDWSIFEQCSLCGEDFDPDDLEEIDGKKYCKECIKNISPKKSFCNMCGNEFNIDNLVSYRGNLYCKSCRNIIKEENKKKKKESNISKFIKTIKKNEETIVLLQNKIEELQNKINDIVTRNMLRDTVTKKTFDYIEHESEFWSWLEKQNTNNRAVKRYVIHGRKSPIDDGIKIFIKFLKEKNYTI